MVLNLYFRPAFNSESKFHIYIFCAPLRIFSVAGFLYPVLPIFFPMPKQIVGLKSNILKSNIQKPKSASPDLTVSTGDKGVKTKGRLYTLRDK